MIAIFNSSRRVSLRHGFLTSLALGMLFIPTLTIAQPNKAIAEEIEWIWEVRPQHTDTRLLTFSCSATPLRAIISRR
jgi:hypothetical protein